MNIGSVFSGIGGFDLGAERAGLSVSWQCEIEPNAASVLEKHWPNTLRWGDARTIDATTREWACDVLCGGFPCQDVSLCGKMAGLDGENSRLFWEFARIAEESGPRWIVLENVPGLLTGNSGRDFLTIIRALGQRGYVCAYRIFDARYFGCPQRRPRVFIVGHLGDWTGPARVVFDGESVVGNNLQSEKKRDFTTGGVDASARIVRRPFVFSPRIARCNRGLPSDLLPTLTSYEKGGMHADSKPHVVTNKGIRRLTALEHERAMGFPDNWTAGLDDRTRRALCGNAVVPAIAEWILKRIVTDELPKDEPKC
jgi:DNA (cytosine-5)-methyltransferase 1